MAKIDSLGSFETGHAKIDRDHLRLIDVINAMEDALQAQDLRSCRKLIRTLNRQMKKHFKREGAIIRKLGFPDATQHCNHHETALAKAKKLQHSFNESSHLERLKEQFRNLKAIVIEEIVRDDLSYKPYLEGHFGLTLCADIRHPPLKDAKHTGEAP